MTPFLTSVFQQYLQKLNQHMTKTMLTQSAVHPMAKFQRQIQSLVDSKVIQPEDRLWKIAFLFNDDWGHWKKELEDFEFSMQDSISDLLAVESWEDD
jgi:hypothetical protein